MPRPNAKWREKHSSKPVHRLSGNDDFLSAAQKLAGSSKGSYAVLLQMLHYSKQPHMCLLDMDDMKMHDEKIQKTYHEWSGNDYDKLLKAITDRDSKLIAFLERL